MPEEPNRKLDGLEMAALQRFLRRRDDLNERLDQTKQAIDAWLEGRTVLPDMSELATLEALLQNRRDCLAELVDLDDEFMLQLIEMRKRPQKTG